MDILAHDPVNGYECIWAQIDDKYKQINAFSSLSNASDEREWEIRKHHYH